MAKNDAQLPQALTGENISFDTTVSQVTRRLLNYITSGGVEPGQRLPAERVLAEALGVGRSSVREAIAALDLLGIVSVRHGSGTYLRDNVADLLPQTIEWGLVIGRPRTRDLIEARQYLEIITAGRAAVRATPKTLGAVRDALEQMRSSLDDPAAFAEADLRFHFALARISDNSVIADSLTSIRAFLRVWIDRAVADEGGLPRRALEEHRAILDAVTAGDVPAAESAMRAHMEAAGARLRHSVGD